MRSSKSSRKMCIMKKKKLYMNFLSLCTQIFLILFFHELLKYFHILHYLRESKSSTSHVLNLSFPIHNLFIYQKAQFQLITLPEGNLSSSLGLRMHLITPVFACFLNRMCPIFHPHSHYSNLGTQ